MYTKLACSLCTAAIVLSSTAMPCAATYSGTSASGTQAPVLSQTPAAAPVNQMVTATVTPATQAQDIIAAATLADGRLDTSKVAASLGTANSYQVVNAVCDQVMGKTGDITKNFNTVSDISSKIADYMLLTTAIHNNRTTVSGASVKMAMINGLGTKLTADCSVDGTLDNNLVARKMESFDCPIRAAQAMVSLSMSVKAGAAMPSLDTAKLTETFNQVSPLLRDMGTEHTRDYAEKICARLSAYDVNWSANTLTDGRFTNAQIADGLTRINSAALVNAAFNNILSKTATQTESAIFNQISDITKQLPYKLISTSLTTAARSMKSGLTVAGAMYNGLGQKAKSECLSSGALSYALLGKKLQSLNNATLDAQILFGLSYKTKAGSTLPAPDGAMLKTLYTSERTALRAKSLSSGVITALKSITKYDTSLSSVVAAFKA